MSNDYKDPAFKKWLDKLQQESWQLELIISGFAIYGLFIAYEPLKLYVKTAENTGQIYQTFIWLLALVACSILLFNLLLHVILRGLWIGALGLRYVSGEIDYEKLNYSEKFTSYLRKKIGSFDKYIATLENYCSVLFAVSFLLIFYVISFFIIVLLIIAITFLVIQNDSFPQNVREKIGEILIYIIIIGMLLTFVDFITQGILKKKKWISKIYFPIYKIFSFLTLSFLYRPLVYNFLDNKFGKRLSFILIPAYSVILVLTSFKYQNSNYLKVDSSSSSFYANSRNYDDLLDGNDDFVRVASIPSKVIQNSFLKVFIVYTENLEDQLFNYNESLKPKDDQRGLDSDIVSVTDSSDPFKDPSKRDSLSTVYLKTFNEIYTAVIDSTDYDSEFVITTNSKKQLGFEAFLNIKDLSEGKHLLKIQRLRKENHDTVKVTNASIPFWYFND